MADNVLLPTGQTAATDDVGGIQFPRYKPAIGADGVAVDVQPPSDGQATTTALPATKLQHNGTALEMARGNTQGTLLASAARTATLDTAVQTNYNARGVLLHLSVSVASGTGGLQVQLCSVNPISGTLDLNLWPVPTAIITTGDFGYELGPGISTASGAGVGFVIARTSGQLPRSWMVRVSHGNATSYTYSLSYSLIV